MKLSATTKLFLVILATTIIVAAAMGFATRMSFRQGFVNYIVERENKRIDLLTRALADAYQEYGSWSFLRNNPRAWMLIRNEARDDNPPGHHLRPGVPQPPPPHYGPMVLLDAERRPIIGPISILDNAQLYPITVKDETVGYLAKPPIAPFFSQADERFEARQYQALLLIAAFSIFVAAVVAIALTRILLAPLRKMGIAAQLLAAGNYSTRITINSRDELGQLACDFNHLAHTLARNEVSRREFMADIAHELRTPLAILKGELEALSDGVRVMTKDSIVSLEAEVATLNKLVDDLSQLSLADRGALAYHKTSIDIVFTLERALGAYRERFNQQSIALETNIAGPLFISGDPERLVQLFNNLLENTLRYTDPNGLLRVTAKNEAGKILIDFQDSAPGVPPEILPRLFERLYRFESSRNRASGGSGLGLSIAASIIEAHNGTIDAKTSPFGGIWVAITLPAIAA